MYTRNTSILLAACIVAVALLPSDIVAQPEGTGSSNANFTTMSHNIVENLQPGVFVSSIVNEARLTEIFDQNTTNALQFEVLKGPFKDYFSIESPSGLLKTRKVIDRDVLCPKQTACILGLDVAIIRPSQRFRVFKLEVTIIDLNDNSPRFDPSSVTISVSESAHPGTILVLPAAQDLDSGIFDVQNYTFSCNSSKFELLALKNSDGTHDLQLLVKDKLDRELEDSYFGTVTAIDGGNPVLTGTLDITILVKDANDNLPVFDKTVYNASIREDFPLNGILVWVHASDADEGSNSEIVYDFARQTKSAFGSMFSIDSRRGDISLKQSLDFERESLYTLLVMAKDSGPDSIPVYAKVLIAVEDLNDNAPTIRTNAVDNNGFAEVAENEPIMSFVAHISAEDPDSGANGEVSCELVQGKGFGLQQLYPKEFKLVTTTGFDREQTDQYSVTVLCHDNGNPVLSTSKDIVVKIVDSNDNPPVFDQKDYTASIREGIAEGSPILRVNASDADSGPNALIEYGLCPDARGLVSIDNSTGLVTARVAFDFEKTKEVRFCVTAVDRGPQRLSSTAIVSVNVIDVNDETPSFGQSAYTFGTYENQPPNSEIGTVSAVDADHSPFDKFIFSIVKERPELDSFSIDPYSGRITTTKVLDREQCVAHYLTIAATNVAFPNPSSTANVTIYVADKNDNAPHVEFPTRENNTVEVSSFTAIGSTFVRIFASDSDSGINAKLNYAIVKGNRDNSFDIDPISGAVSINKDLKEIRDSDRKNFRLVISVSDSGIPSKLSEVVLNVVLTSSPALGNLVQQTSSGLELTSHRKILILVGGVTAVLVSILITSIVCIKWRQAVYKRNFRRYWPGRDCSAIGGCSEESRYLNISDCYSAMKNDQDQKNMSPIYKNSQGGNQKNVHFDLDMDPTAASDQSQNLANQSLKMKRSCNIHGRNKNLAPVNCYEHVDVHIPVTGPDLDASQVNHIPGLGTQDGIDSDSTSGCSTDMSNSDTGRGPCDCYTTNHHSRQRHHHHHYHSHSPIICDNNLQEKNCHQQEQQQQQLSNQSAWTCPVPPESSSNYELKIYEPISDLGQTAMVVNTSDNLHRSSQDLLHKTESSSPSVHSSPVKNFNEVDMIIPKGSALTDSQTLKAAIDFCLEAEAQNNEQKSRRKPAVPPRNTSLKAN